MTQLAVHRQTKCVSICVFVHIYVCMYVCVCVCARTYYCMEEGSLVCLNHYHHQCIRTILGISRKK